MKKIVLSGKTIQSLFPTREQSSTTLSQAVLFYKIGRRTGFNVHEEFLLIYWFKTNENKTFNTFNIGNHSDRDEFPHGLQ